MGLGGEEVDQALLPSDHEAQILSGGATDTDREDMSGSWLEMDADREEADDEDRLDHDDDEEEEEEEEGGDFNDDGVGSSFFEENEETAEEGDKDMLFSSEASDDEAEGGEGEILPSSFVETYEETDASIDPWGLDEEEEEETDEETDEETGDRLMPSADPYDDTDITGSSFIETDEVAHDDDDEFEGETTEAEDEFEPSFFEEEDEEEQEEEEGKTADEQGEGDSPLSFIQLESRRTVEQANTSRQQPKSSFVQAPLAPHDFSDQTEAENEMLTEAGESPVNSGEEESGRAMSQSAGGEAMGEEGGDSDEGIGSARGLEETEGERGGAIPGAEEQQDEIYEGPADPLIRYGGRSEEDVETGRAPSDEGLAEEGPSDEETGGGEETLQQQRPEETAGDKGNAVSPTTEEELAADLQGAYPRLHASTPHVVQRRHVDQDIRMTEALRTEGKAAASGATSPLSFLSIAATTGVLMLLFA
ncbi:hypothetical protein ACSSS7_005677 [Eimeria intestinalis]